MKILITGAAGFIGSHLSEKLIELGYEVIGLDCIDTIYPKPVKYENIEKIKNHKNFTFRRANMAAKSELDILNFDLVVHLAAKPGIRWSFQNFKDTFFWNTYATAELIDYCLKRRIKYFINVSSSTVYGAKKKAFVETDILNPTSPYGLSKKQAEESLKMFCDYSGLKAISLRFFSVYGPRQRPDLIAHKLINSILNKKQVEIFGDGTQERDFTYVSDIVDGIVKSIEYVQKMEESYNVFNLGKGDKHKLNKVIDLVEKEFNTPCNLVYVPKNIVDLNMTLANHDKATHILGWEPKVAIEEGISEMANWYRWNRDWLIKTMDFKTNYPKI